MNQTIYKLTCERCGEEFQATRYWARYCSDACRVADYWKRRKERQCNEDTPRTKADR